MASHRWPNGSTRAWRRLQVLDRDGYRCTHIDGRGRCTATYKLEVHHLQHGRKQVARTRDLATICRDHHIRTFRAVGAHA